MTTPASLALDLDGCTDLPPGKIASVVTYLEMNAPPPRRAGLPDDLSLERFVDAQRYRALFDRIGRDWLWFGRARLTQDALAAILRDPGLEAWAILREGAEIGLLELDFRQAGAAELVYFGLVPEAAGRGLGKALIEEAIERAFAQPGVRRLFVHTCTLDDPKALPFYVRAGFRAYKRAIEVSDDPRLTGLLPITSAPREPLIPAK